jgi:hypothetical protein
MHLPCPQLSLAEARMPSVAVKRHHRVALAQAVAWRVRAAGNGVYNLAGAAAQASDSAAVARGRAIHSH